MAIDRNNEQDLLRTFSRFPIRKPGGKEGEKMVLILGRPSMHGTRYGSPEALFSAVGASSTDCLDISNFEGANVVHDMNTPIPPDLHERYCLVFDNGTMEHCFDVAQFMVNIHRLVAPEGLVIQSNPTNNYVNHGFYQFSPNFYLAFYLQNGYEILRIAFRGVQKTFLPGRAAIQEVVFEKEVDPEHFSRLVMTPRLILESAYNASIMTTITFVARKKTSVDCEIPQQPIYSRKFRGYKSEPILTL
jgi:hypothetical protein